jgi:hypothetical protein
MVKNLNKKVQRRNPTGKFHDKESMERRNHTQRLYTGIQRQKPRLGGLANCLSDRSITKMINKLGIGIGGDT